MTTRRFGLTVVLTSVLAASVLAVPAPAAAQSSECNLAQASATASIEAAMKRLEEARLTNSLASMRAATHSVEAALIYIRALLAPCAVVQAASADAHAGHVMPAATEPPSVSTVAAAATPAATVTAAPAAATPAAADAHAGHVMPAAAPTVVAVRQAAAVPPPAASAAPNPASLNPAAPAAVDAHAGHVMPAAPAAAPRSSSVAAATAAATPAGAAAAPVRPGPVALPGGRTPAVSADALTCAANVDRRAAPRVMYQGKMYYFCSEQERTAFAKEPAKYVR